MSGWAWLGVACVLGMLALLIAAVLVRLFERGHDG